MDIFINDDLALRGKSFTIAKEEYEAEASETKADKSDHQQSARGGDFSKTEVN